MTQCSIKVQLILIVLVFILLLSSPAVATKNISTKYWSLSFDDTGGLIAQPYLNKEIWRTGKFLCGLKSLEIIDNDFKETSPENWVFSSNKSFLVSTKPADNKNVYIEKSTYSGKSLSEGDENYLIINISTFNDIEIKYNYKGPIENSTIHGLKYECEFLSQAEYSHIPFVENSNEASHDYQSLSYSGVGFRFDFIYNLWCDKNGTIEDISEKNVEINSIPPKFSVILMPNSGGEHNFSYAISFRFSLSKSNAVDKKKTIYPTIIIIVIASAVLITVIVGAIKTEVESIREKYLESITNLNDENEFGDPRERDDDVGGRYELYNNQAFEGNESSRKDNEGPSSGNFRDSKNKISKGNDIINKLDQEMNQSELKDKSVPNKKENLFSPNFRNLANPLPDIIEENEDIENEGNQVKPIISPINRSTNDIRLTNSSELLDDINSPGANRIDFPSRSLENIIPSKNNNNNKNPEYNRNYQYNFRDTTQFKNTAPFNMAKNNDPDRFKPKHLTINENVYVISPRNKNPPNVSPPSIRNKNSEKKLPD